MDTHQLVLPFLIPQENFEHIFCSVHRQLKPRTPVPRIDVEFFPFAGINHTARLNEGQLKVRVSDLFEEAPQDVKQALAVILLAKLYGKKIDASIHRTYRAFVLRTEIQERARVARNDRGRGTRVTHARGRHFDLEELFERINRSYFGGGLAKPCLSWSAKRSRHILGRYDATYDTIFISRVFDAPRVPGYVIEYVMYHEMLHIKHNTRVQDCRVLVHTPEFRNDERRFAEYAAAKHWLEQI